MSSRFSKTPSTLASTRTGRVRRTHRLSTAARARAMATTSRWTRGRCSSRIITRVTSAGWSMSAIRRFLPAITTAGLATRSLDGAGAPCWAVSSVAHAVAVGSALPTPAAIPPVYRCDKLNVPPGQRRHCFSFGGKRIDGIVAAEILRAVAPMAIEAAEEAERMLRDEDQDRRRIAELGLQQAQYEASLAERRYAACDPDNRLITAQLEKAWEAALQRVEASRQRLDALREPDAGDACPEDRKSTRLN